MQSQIPASVDILLLSKQFHSSAPSDHLCKPDFPKGHKALSVKSYQTRKQRQKHFCCGLRNRKLTNASCTIFIDNYTCIVRVTEKWGAFVLPLLQWKNIKYYIWRECLLGELGIPHAWRMRLIVTVGWRALQYFLHYIIKDTNFGVEKRSRIIMRLYWCFLQIFLTYFSF